MDGYRDEVNDISSFLKFQKLSCDCYLEQMTAAAQADGLTVQEAMVLVFFYNNPVYDTAADAARYRGFSKVYLSKAVERLLAKGFLRVETDPADRRCQHIRLEPYAYPAAQRLRETQECYVTSITEGILPQEREALCGLMRRITGNIMRMNEGKTE